MKKSIRLRDNAGLLSVMASVTSICIGLLFGLLLLLLLNPGNALAGMGNLLSKGFTDVGNVLYRAAPLIMVGLAVAFAYQVGLFNIGASGQYTVGTFLALTCAIELQQPWYVCILAAALGGALWGLFPGLFKALFNVNEVLTAIMFNWIGMNLVNFLVPNLPRMLDSDWGASASDRTAALVNANPDAVLPRLGLDKLFHYSYMNIGIFLAMILAVVMWVILKKTTFGYELKACGHNRDTAVYAGISAKKNIVLSMVISGALCGIAGALNITGISPHGISTLAAFENNGFNGLSVAFIAGCSPVACIPASLLFAGLIYGGQTVQQTMGAPSEIISIMIGTIVFCMALGGVIPMLAEHIQRSRAERAEQARKLAAEAGATPVAAAGGERLPEGRGRGRAQGTGGGVSEGRRTY